MCDTERLLKPAAGRPMGNRAGAGGRRPGQARDRGAGRAGQGTWSRLQSERRSSLFSASMRRWYSVRDTTW